MLLSEKKQTGGIAVCGSGVGAVRGYNKVRMQGRV